VNDGFFNLKWAHLQTLAVIETSREYSCQMRLPIGQRWRLGEKIEIYEGSLLQNRGTSLSEEANNEQWRAQLSEGGERKTKKEGQRRKELLPYITTPT